MAQLCHISIVSIDKLLYMTQNEAGFRAVFNDPIFKDQTLINYIYQSELARNVRSLGYAINNDAKGKWEIAGFSDQWVESFSIRSREIDEALEHTTGSDKENGAKKRDRAQKSSRAAKDLELTPERAKPPRWRPSRRSSIKPRLKQKLRSRAWDTPVKPPGRS